MSGALGAVAAPLTEMGPMEQEQGGEVSKERKLLSHGRTETSLDTQMEIAGR